MSCIQNDGLNSLIAAVGKSRPSAFRKSVTEAPCEVRLYLRRAKRSTCVLFKFGFPPPLSVSFGVAVEVAGPLSVASELLAWAVALPEEHPQRPLAGKALLQETCALTAAEVQREARIPAATSTQFEYADLRFLACIQIISSVFESPCVPDASNGINVKFAQLPHLIFVSKFSIE